MKKVHRCVLLTLAPFPVGNVSTLRYSSYLKELVRKGIPSKVIIYAPTSMAACVKYSNGVSDGIDYEYSTKVTWGRISRFFKPIYLIFGLISSIFIIKKYEANVLILYGENIFFVNLFYKIVSKLLNLKYIGDRSEYPSIKTRQSKLRIWFYKLKTSWFDGMLVMTKELEKYYKSCSKKNNFTFLLPMTITPERFEKVKKHNVEEKYIAVVFGTHNRDGLYESLNSFAYYINKLNGIYKMVLIGDFENMPNVIELKKVIIENKIENKIELKGKVSINEVPSLLKSASCLLTTPNFYISGGFPTKLGEYMLSEAPIVATKVGELDQYVEDKQDLLFCEKSNFKSIAESIKWIETHEIEAQNMGKRAAKKAKTVFNAETYVNKLVHFIDTI